MLSPKKIEESAKSSDHSAIKLMQTATGKTGIEMITMVKNEPSEFLLKSNIAYYMSSDDNDDDEMPSVERRNKQLLDLPTPWQVKDSFYKYIRVKHS